MPLVLEKRGAGGPLSEAELKQRREAARARWRNAGIGAAAGGVAGAVAGEVRVRRAGAAHTAAREAMGEAIEATEAEGERRSAGWTKQVRARRRTWGPWVVPAFKQHLKERAVIADTQAAIKGGPLEVPDADPSHPFHGVRSGGPDPVGAGVAEREAASIRREIADLDANARPPRQHARRETEATRRAREWEHERRLGRGLIGGKASKAAYEKAAQEYERKLRQNPGTNEPPPRPQDFNLRVGNRKVKATMHGRVGSQMTRSATTVRRQGVPGDDGLRRMRRVLNTRLEQVTGRIENFEGQRLDEARRATRAQHGPAVRQARGVLRSAIRTRPWLAAGGAAAGAAIGYGGTRALEKRELSEAERKQRSEAAKARWADWRKGQAVERLKGAKASGQRLVYRGAPEPDFKPKKRSYEAVYFTKEKGHARDYAVPYRDGREQGWITSYGMPKGTPTLDLAVSYRDVARGEVTPDQKRAGLRHNLALQHLISGTYGHKASKKDPYPKAWSAKERWSYARKEARRGEDPEAADEPDIHPYFEAAHVDPYPTDVRGLRRMGYAGSQRGRAYAMHDHEGIKPLYARHTETREIKLAKALTQAQTEQRRAAAKARWAKWHQGRGVGTAGTEAPAVGAAPGPVARVRPQEPKRRAPADPFRVEAQHAPGSAPTRARKPIILHVNRQVIARNAKQGTADPAIIIRRGRRTEYAHEVELIGRAKMVYSPHKPMAGGARLWIEAEDARPTVHPLAKRDTPAIAAAARATALDPTPAQARAGNYAKGKVELHGLLVVIETPRGAVRRGVSPNGHAWACTVPGHYGYLAGTVGRDGEALDVTLGPRAHDASAPVFVVDQVDPRSLRFDEHKVFLGWPDREAAVQAYDDSFADGSGPRRRAAVTRMSVKGFRAWALDGQKTKPAAGALYLDRLGKSADGADDDGEPEPGMEPVEPGPGEEGTEGEKALARSIARLLARWADNPREAGDPEQAKTAVAPVGGVYEEAARQATEEVLRSGGRTLTFNFRERFPRVLRAIEDFKIRLSGRVSSETREAIRQTLHYGASEGLPVETQARRIRESIGVSPGQNGWIRRYRGELERGEFEKAMSRALRDRRHDRTLERLRDEGGQLDPEQIDKMVGSYHRRVLAYRSTVIARSEALRAASYGQVAGMKAFLEQNPHLDVEKVWMATTTDEKTREAHVKLHGKSVIGIETPFEVQTEAGPRRIRWPQDEDAHVDMTAQCRCTLVFRVVPKAGSGRLVAEGVGRAR